MEGDDAHDLPLLSPAYYFLLLMPPFFFYTLLFSFIYVHETDKKLDIVKDITRGMNK